MPILFARARKSGNGKKDEARRPWTLREIFSGHRRHEVQGIAWWACSLLLAAAYWPHAAGRDALGPAGEILYRLSYAALGAAMVLVPLFLVLYGVLVFRGRALERRPYKFLGLGLGLLSVAILINLIHPQGIDLERVRAFYAGADARRFWSGIPRAFHLWDAVTLPAGGLPAKFLADFLITIFSTVGTYIVCGTVLVISLYLLEMETRVMNAAKGLAAWVRAFSPKKLPLDYAQPDSPSKRPAAEAKLQAPAPPPEKPRIRISSRPSETRASSWPEREPAAAPKGRGPARDAPDPGAGAAAFAGQTYRLPDLDFLREPETNAAVSASYFEHMSQTLETALAQFGVSAKVVEVCPGPVVTRYELQPAPGVKVNRILSLEDDITLAMKAEHVRIEAPIPGKGAVGIEIPNQEKQVVNLKELLASPEFGAAESALTFAVGKDIGGQKIFADLDGMPHLLIAGATGSGKSACINAIICSLLYRATPRQARFLMIDPKRVELTIYNGIPHLKSPVITDNQQAAVALKLLVREMEERYKIFAHAGVRDILAYNQQVEQLQRETETGEPESAAGPAESAPAPMPYIVVFIDELADLMLVAPNDVENALTRLAQMARGVGIHLVLATQRPSVDVITGVIKANFPSRVAFQVSSKVDSRTILDANGADTLLGRGDMLYSPASASKPLRVQGVFVTTPEVERLTQFWRQQGEPVYDPAFTDSKLKAASAGNGGDAEEDELYPEAVSWVVRAKQASTSLLQRRLKIGYSRAARLLDMMEDKGVVGPPEGSKPRKVLVSAEALEAAASDAEE